MARITLLVVTILVVFDAIPLEASLRLPFGPRPNTSAKNLATGKKTSQSSTQHGGLSKRAVDGKMLTNYFSSSCTHTASTNKPWWKVDLGQRYFVSNLKITNRGDCCGSRLSNFDVKVDNKLCKYHPGAVKQGATIDIRCSKPLAGRNVMIQLRGRNYLTLCEVQVFGELPVQPAPKNLATGKRTSQSSTRYGGESKRAVDRNKLTNYFSSSCTHTASTNKPWWKVDLGQRYLVSNLKITNRGDCCGSRLSNFDVKVDNKLCKYHPGAVKQGATIDIRCSKPLAGRNVMIQLRGRNYLTLCEVQVFGELPVQPAPKNLATGKRTSQSSTRYGGESKRAVDRNKLTNYFSSSCTHTASTNKPWWKVDLGQRYLVSNLKITNRGDCCGSRLSNFDVKVDNKLCKYHPGVVKQGATIDIRCSKPLAGRNVMIQLRGRNYLTLCEVQVFGELPVQPAPKNLATGKRTSQSSTRYGGESKRAVDRNKLTNYFSSSCTHTASTNKPWWKVDLGERYLVSNLKITNRGDCCGSRLSNFDVKVDSKLCKYHPGAVKQGATIDIRCNYPLVGRNVMIQLRGRNYLTLCEVQVFGKPPVVSVPRNLATGKKTSQSSSAYGDSRRAIDGNKFSEWHGNSCTHTNSDPKAWWQVDLGKRYIVGSVKITNRGDCCANRLSNFDVKVDNYLCKYHPGAVAKGATITLKCDRRLDGRIVKIQLRGKNYLTLCEVQVFSGC